MSMIPEGKAAYNVGRDHLFDRGEGKAALIALIAMVETDEDRQTVASEYLDGWLRGQIRDARWLVADVLDLEWDQACEFVRNVTDRIG